MNIRLLCLLASALLLTGCPWDKNENNPPSAEQRVIELLGKPAEDLTLADFAPPTYDSIDASDVAFEIEAEEDFGSKAPASLQINGGNEDSCVKNAMGDPIIEAGHNGNGQVTVNLVGLEKCPSFELPFTKIEYIVLSITFDDIQIVDQFNNPVDIVGKHLRELDNLKLITASQRGLMRLKATTTFDEFSLSFDSRAKYKMHQQGNIAQACDLTGNLEGCVGTTIDQISFQNIPDSTETNYRELRANTLYYQADAPFYYGGTVDFQFNNWNGTMQYGDSGFDTPTYTASNELNETITGSYESHANNMLVKPRTNGTFEQPVESVASQIQQIAKTAIHSALREAKPH
ncbi:MAG: hypothetical protein OEW58_13530 [Gammaproteobacteria bacterium]|nr:hypothetical protein [Gammaproteobacteria bacterium]